MSYRWTGVQKGDNQSPLAIVDVFINELAEELNSMDDETITVLIYADDIVMVSETKEHTCRSLLTH